MNIIDTFSRIYDENLDKVGVPTDNPNIWGLWPIFHAEKKADIEIVLNEKGVMVECRVLNETNRNTLAPICEMSESKTKNIVVAPLVEKLSYIALNATKYFSKKNCCFKDGQELCSAKFISILNEWSEFTKEDVAKKKLKAIINYVSCGSIISDLIQNNVLLLDGKTLAFNKRPHGNQGPFNKFNAETPEKLIVRWSVQIKDVKNESCSNDPKMWESWQDFYINSYRKQNLSKIIGDRKFEDPSHKEEIQGTGSLCYATGMKNVPLAILSPKQCHRYKANAKIISSDDDKDYTFRGMFKSFSACSTTSFVENRKAHSALRWIVSNYGFNSGKNSVTFALKNRSPLSEMEIYDPFDVDVSTTDDSHFQQKEFQQMLRLKKNGFNSDDDTITIVTLSALTDGRISVSSYGQIKCSQYIQNIKKWMASTLLYFPENNSTRTLTPHSINSAYNFSENPSDSLCLKIFSDVQNAILNGMPINRSIAARCYQNAIKAISCNKADGQQELNLIHCAYALSPETEKTNIMKYNKENTNYSYLFGSLLAVADSIESRVTYLKCKDAEKRRTTSATKYLRQFSLTPYTTWSHIHLRLAPYLSYLQKNKPDTFFFFQNEISQILSRFEEGAFQRNAPLNPDFLVAYYLLKNEYCSLKQTSKKETTFSPAE